MPNVGFQISHIEYHRSNESRILPIAVSLPPDVPNNGRSRINELSECATSHAGISSSIRSDTGCGKSAISIISRMPISLEGPSEDPPIRTISSSRSREAPLYYRETKQGDRYHREYGIRRIVYKKGIQKICIDHMIITDWQRNDPSVVFSKSIDRFHTPPLGTLPLRLSHLPPHSSLPPLF